MSKLDISFYHEYFSLEKVQEESNNQLWRQNMKKMQVAPIFNEHGLPY